MTIDKDSDDKNNGDRDIDDKEGRQDQNYVEHVSHLPTTSFSTLSLFM